MAAALPADARFIELTDCGHVTYAEQPDAFAHAVAVFAAELDRARPGPIRLTKGREMSTNSISELTANRFEVRSGDGTPIAVWVEGTGPALVMVHGSIADHTTFEPFVAELRHHLTTFAMDRRGFGASGDTADYSIERDFDDVAAAVDAVAASHRRTRRPGGPLLRRQLRHPHPAVHRRMRSSVRHRGIDLDMTDRKGAQMLQTPLCENLGVDLPIWNAGMGGGAAGAGAGRRGVQRRRLWGPRHGWHARSADPGRDPAHPRQLTTLPFGVNLLLPFVEDGQIQTCLDESVAALGAVLG